MSYEDLVYGYDAVINKLGKKSVDDILHEYQKFGNRFGYGYSRLYKELVDFVNQPEFIEFIKDMQKYTTNPPWFDLLEGFLVADPENRKNAIEGYPALGLSEDFIKLLFYSSGRPRVNLKPYLDAVHVNPRFQTIEPYEYVLQPSTVLPLTVADPPDGILLNVYMPVNRYQLGMSGYYTTINEENKGKTWCGTFYYYEPDSPFILYAPKVLVSWNKITACLDLGMDFEDVFDILYNSRKDWIVGEDVTPDPIKDGYPNNMGFQVEGVTKEEQWRNVVKGYQSRSLDPTKHMSNMYAAEDEYDQYLCELARDNGIDVVILKYMTGETRVVSEILDTRDRVSSFENIIFPPLP